MIRGTVILVEAHANVNIGVMGINNVRKGERIAFNSKTALYDFDIFLLDLNDIATEFVPHGVNKQSFYKEEQITLNSVISDIINRRKAEFKEFIEMGKWLIVTLPVPQKINAEIQYDLKNILPCSFSVVHKEGKKIDIAQNTKFSDFFKKYIQFFHYNSYFERTLGSPLLYIKGTKNCVSSIYNNILFVPPLNVLSPNAEHDLWDDLIDVLLKKDEETDINLPKWSGSYFLPAEKVKVESINNIEKNIEILLKEKDQYLNELNKINKRKILLCGTGDLLVKEVKSTLTEIGFEILNAEQGRADLIVKYKEQLAVVEVKGVTGTAAEKNAAQLEKWVTNYHAENEVHPKGILIVNSFKDVELAKRSEITFPHQMLKFTTQREHCLITSVQLLCMSLEIQKNPTMKEELIESLFSTIGVYNNYTNWNEYIEISNTPEL